MPTAIFLPAFNEATESLADLVERTIAANPGRCKLYCDGRRLAWLPKRPANRDWFQVGTADRDGRVTLAPEAA